MSLVCNKRQKFILNGGRLTKKSFVLILLRFILTNHLCVSIIEHISQTFIGWRFTFCIKVWIFLKSYFFKISWAFLSSELDSPVIKTLERHSLNVKKCLSNVLITWESNFDERNGQEMFNWPDVHSLS